MKSRNIEISRVLIIFMASILVLWSIRLLDSSRQFHYAYKWLSNLQQTRNSDYDLTEFKSAVDSLPKGSVIDGDYSEFIARAYSFIAAKQGADSLVTPDQLVAAYWDATVSNPHDGFVWASLALVSSRSYGVSEPMLQALDYALEFGRNDYETMRRLSHIAIRSWPWLDCNHKIELYGVIHDSLRKNDDIIVWWNVERGHMPIGKYVTKLMQAYQFNENWAKRQVDVCQFGRANS